MLLNIKTKTMKLSQFKDHLAGMQELAFTLPSGVTVPAHFHITEAGLTTKHFIDCGGTLRTEKTANLQVWVANDVEHRLAPSKLITILDMSAPLFLGEDLEMEIEYQAETIGRYGLQFENGQFLLMPKQTDCLAKENCGVPKEKQKLSLAELTTEKESCCTPGGGCCN